MTTRTPNKLHRAFGLGLLLTLLQACATVGPDYVAPDINTRNVIAPEELSPTLARETRWWQHFDDPALDQIVTMALENNLSLKMAAANVKKSLAVFGDVDNDDLPKGSLGAQANAQDQIVPGMGDQRRNQRSYELGAHLQWSIDAFGRIERLRQQAQANAEAEWYALRALQIELIAQAVQAYGDLKGLKARIALAHDNIASVGRTKTLVSSRVEEGFAPQLDLHRIEAQHYRIQASVPVLETAYANTRHFLEALLGSEQALAFLDQNVLSESLLRIDRPFAIGNAQAFLRYRPDVQRAERQLAAASASIGANEAALYPDLSVGGFIGFFAGDLADLGSGSEAWRIAPSLQWNLLDRSSLKARIAIAEADEQARYFAFQQTVIDAIKQAENSLLRYRKQQEHQHLLAAQLQASRDAYALARLRYESGEASLLDLLDAERSVLEVEDTYAASNTATFSAIVAVYAAFGGGVSHASDPLASDLET